jgi:hypothetical protein
LKPRYLITAVAVPVLLAAAWFIYGQADRPTSRTSTEALVARVLPDELEALTGPGDPSVDAGPLYEQAVALCVEREGVLTRTREHDELVDGLSDLLLRAAQAGRVEPGFMDGHIPVEIGAQPDYGPALENITEWVLHRAAARYEVENPRPSRELVGAVWVFGQRLFEDNTRLYTRNTGLDMMESAGSLLFEMSVEGSSAEAEVLRAWSSALDGVRRAWQPKLEVMLRVDPHPGDLVNIAVNDADRMFRVEATLRLGIHRHGADRGNRRAMQRAIRAAMASDDPMLAEAGRAADALTLEEKRRLY